MPNVPATKVSQDIRNRTKEKLAVRCALAAEVLRTSGMVSLRVFGCSMLPSIWPGDIIAVRHAQVFDIRPGTLVLYAREAGRFIVHRAVSCNPDILITRGDALKRNDAPVQPSQILGEVVSIQRGRSRLVPAERLGRAQSLFRFFLLRSDRFRSLILRLYSLRLAINHAQPCPESLL